MPREVNATDRQVRRPSADAMAAALRANGYATSQGQAPRQQAPWQQGQRQASRQMPQQPPRQQAPQQAHQQQAIRQRPASAPAPVRGAQAASRPQQQVRQAQPRQQAQRPASRQQGVGPGTQAIRQAPQARPAVTGEAMGAPDHAPSQGAYAQPPRQQRPVRQAQAQAQAQPRRQQQAPAPQRGMGYEAEPDGTLRIVDGEGEGDGAATDLMGRVLTVSVLMSATLTPFALLYAFFPSRVLAVLSLPFPLMLAVVVAYVVITVVIGLRIAWVFGCGPWGMLTAPARRGSGTPSDG